MAIEAGTTAYYQATRAIPQDGLIFYVDPSIRESYQSQGDTRIYSLVDPTHYMKLDLVNSVPVVVRGRQNSGIRESTNGTGPMAIEGLASTYGLSFINSTYIFYAKCEVGFPVSGGSFSNWILQIGSYYANGSWGLGLQSNSLMVYARGSAASGWTYASGTANGQSIYTSNLNQWIFYVVQFIGNDAFKVYMNNTLCYNVTSLAQVYTGISNNAVYLGRSQRQTVGLFAAYDKVTSDEETTQFYNATRHRFGI